ncbi:MAG TPA: response regulator [Bryobacteraceae bacterium]|nr:response regulator [Bryobacteraceae bacterium]
MHRLRFADKLSAVCASIAVAISLLALYGWHIGSHALIAWSSDIATMKVNVSAAAILAAVSLLTLRGGSRVGWFSDLTAAASMAIGLVTLAEYAFHWNAGIDERFVRDLDPGAGLAAGRMAPSSALCFVLIAVALLLARRRSSHRAAQFVCLPAGMIVILSLSGYFYGSTELSRLAPFGPMALNTTIACAFLLTGLMLEMPESGLIAPMTLRGLSGTLARRLIPMAVFVPLAAGWLTLRGENLGLYGPEFGLAIFSVLTIVALVFFLAGSVNFLSRIEITREKTDLDLKRQRDALKHQAELIDLSNDAIIIADSRRRIVAWNGGAEALYGWREKEAIGQHMHDFLRTSSAVPVSEIDEVLRARHSWEGQLIQTCRDGKQVTVDSRQILRPDAEGAPGRFLEINRDITDRKRLEEQLFQSQKMESLGQLAGGIAHDFNNLLTVINGYCELLLGAPEGDRRYLDDVRQIRSAGDQAAKLTQQLLAFSRKQLLKSVVLNLNHVIGDTTRMLRRLIGSQIDLVMNLAPDLANVRGDAVQVQQILVNLVVNARDAMPSGGSLRIETRNITRKSQRADGAPPIAQPFVQLTVADTGSGIKPEILERIFEPFFTTKSRERGTGLGLATVYGIVQQMGGEIEVDSRIGSGTAFHLCFPRTDEPIAVSASIAPADLRGSENILVVEDQENVRTLIVTALEGFGYKVWNAANGQQALAFCESHKGRLDLLISDIVMPGMDGNELAVHIQKARPGIRILLISGYTNRAIAATSVPQGAAYLPKPFTPETLGEKVRQLLARPVSQKSVLLVDDDAPVRRAMRRFLMNAGFSVNEAANGKEAIDQLAQHPNVDLVVTDMVMDVQGGEEMIGHLRRSHPKLRIIAMSGAFGDDDRETAARLGVAATLRKPFTWQILLETVRRVLTD